MERVEIFECQGRFAFLRAVHRFTFVVYPDQSVHVAIVPVNEFESDSRPMPHLATLNDGTEAFEDGEVDHTTKVVAIGGHIVLETSQAICYIVNFKLGQSRQFVTCLAHLAREPGESVQFMELAHNNCRDFTLQTLSHRVAAINPTTQLLPLTPGRYILQGITVAANNYVYECTMELLLKTNGTLSGTSRELPFAQECPVLGTWTRTGFHYSLQYEMHGNKHTYNYDGTVFHSLLRGTWRNAALQLLGQELDPDRNQAEHGILEFQSVETSRSWSHAYHQDYPVIFKQCIKLLLLASHRHGLLPSHLWCLIVSYCGYNWFRKERHQ